MNGRADPPRHRGRTPSTDRPVAEEAARPASRCRWQRPRGGTPSAGVAPYHPVWESPRRGHVASREGQRRKDSTRARRVQHREQPGRAVWRGSCSASAMAQLERALISGPASRAPCAAPWDAEEGRCRRCPAPRRSCGEQTHPDRTNATVRPTGQRSPRRRSTRHAVQVEARDPHCQHEGDRLERPSGVRTVPSGRGRSSVARRGPHRRADGVEHAQNQHVAQVRGWVPSLRSRHDRGDHNRRFPIPPARAQATDPAWSVSTIVGRPAS